MKYRRPLRSHLSLFSLLPGVICALLVGAYLSYAMMRDVGALQATTGKAFGDNIAHLAYTPITDKNFASLQHIALITLENPIVHSISFYDNDKQVVSHAGPRHEIIDSDEDRFFTTELQEISSTRNRQVIIPITQPRLTAELALNTSNTPHQSAQAGWVRIELSYDYLLLQKYKSAFVDFFIVTLILAATFWLTTPFGDRLVSTIKEQIEGALAISRGNHGAGLPASNIQELYALSDAIDRMRRAMFEQQAGLQQHIEQSTKDLRDNMELIEIQNIELNLARREAVQANKVKSEFLANTSHEIRTPLNSIIGFSKLLQKTPLSMQQQDYLQNIQKSSEGLLTIINDVLDLSKIEAGKLVLDHIGFDLYDTVEDILQILAPGAHEKGLELLHMIYSDVPRHLLGDSLRLKQILTNLISNAIKFSEQGRVVVRVAMTSFVQQHAIIKIDVTDTGKGLPNNNNAIFNAFNQLDSSSTREHGGTGLGLAISRKLVEQMSGDIGYHSEPGNTTFWFTFRAEIATDCPETENYSLGERHILVCDREPLCRLALSHSLTRWGSHPIITEQLDQVIPAIEHYADSNHPVDVALIGLAVNHSQDDIIAVQQLVRKIRRNYACKVILCTPTSSKYDFADTFGESIQHLSKPATEKRLFIALRHALQLQSDIPSSEGSRNTLSTLTNRNVLAVDDNPSNLKLISTILREMGANVLEASNGPEAIQLFETSKIDIVFMDIQMPGMDGIETTQQLRQRQKNLSFKTPIIALTAHALAEQRQHLLLSGMDDYLSKPASEQQLLRMLEKWLQADPQVTIDSETTTDDSQLPCVDIRDAMATTGNRPELAAEMLSTLIASIPSSKLHINKAIADENFTKAAEETHRLHGASCYCGTTKLKNTCQSLETALNLKDAKKISESLANLNEAILELEIWQQTNKPLTYFQQA